MVDYKSKYLEYKLKYINAKNKLKGGYVYENEKKIEENKELDEQDGGIIISGPLALGALAVKGAMAAKAAITAAGVAKAVATTGAALAVADQAVDLRNKIKDEDEEDEEDEDDY